MRNELALGLMVALSLFVTMLLEMIPLALAMNLNLWRAPWLLVMVMFWILYLPTVIGIGVAWVAGLFLDVANSAPLGTHALVFTLASALTLAARRLLLTLSVLQQAIWMAALSMIQYGVLQLILPSTGLPGMFQSALSAGLFWLALYFVLYPWVRPRLRTN